MVAEDFIGLTGPSYHVEVERGRIRDFARAMLAPLPEFLEPSDPVIPATFLATAQYSWGYSLERPRGTVFSQIDHDLSVPLHATEEYTFHGPLPRAGETLRAQSEVECVERKSGARGGDLTFITVVTSYRDSEGELVAEQRATTVTTENAPEDEGWSAQPPLYEPSYQSLDPTDPFAGVERADWGALDVGASPGDVTTGPLLMGDIVRFQGVIGEDNPLHHDTAFAASHGYPAVFGLGMHQASALAGYAAHWFDPVGVRSFKATFRDVYWPGDILTYGGRVTEVRPGEADLRLECRRNGGEPLVEVAMVVMETG